MKHTLAVAALLVWSIFTNPTSASNAQQTSYALQSIERGEIAFTPGPDEYDEDGTLSEGYYLNENGKLTCTANVSTVILSGPAPYINRFNNLIRDYAEQNRCSKQLDFTDYIPKVTQIDESYVSVIIEVTTIWRGGNGSCHTHYEYFNFDLENGRDYRLADILRADAFPQIRADIMAQLKADQRIRQEELGELLDRDFWSMGFFIKDRKLYVNLDDYLKSCVDGPFFPIEINPEHIDRMFAPHWLGDALGYKN